MIRLYCLSIESDGYPGELTLLGSDGDRVVFRDRDSLDRISYDLVCNFPKHVFESKEAAMEGICAARVLITSPEYKERIRRPFWCRYGTSSEKAIQDYLDGLLERINRANIVDINDLKMKEKRNDC